MRIALIVPGGVGRSGEHRVIPALVALVERLARHDEVHVYALRQESEPGEWQLQGAHVHSIGTGRGLARTLRLMRGAHRNAPFDVVQSIWSGQYGTLAVVAGKLLGIPSLVHVAGGELVALPEVGYGGALRWRGRLRERLTLGAASAVTAASTPTIEQLMAWGIAAQRIPLGVDLSRWPPRPPLRRAAGAPARLIHVASLNRVKDQPTLLRALAALRESGLSFEMTVIGEDTLAGSIQAAAAELGLSERVKFLGLCTQVEVRARLEQADVMVMSSRHETGPVAMLEAAVAGVPTVGTSVGHLGEWAPSAALAVQVGDSAALAQAVRRLIEDEGLRLRIAAEAQRRAVLEDADYTAGRFRDLYARLSACA